MLSFQPGSFANTWSPTQGFSAELHCSVSCPGSDHIPWICSVFVAVRCVYCMPVHTDIQRWEDNVKELISSATSVPGPELRLPRSPHPPSHLSDTDFLLSLGLLPNLSSPVDTFLVNPESWTVSPSHWATTSVPEVLFGFRDSTSPASNLGSFCFQFLNMLKQSHLDWHLQFFPCFGLKSLLQQGAGTLGMRCFHYLKSIVLKIA